VSDDHGTPAETAIESAPKKEPIFKAFPRVTAAIIALNLLAFALGVVGGDPVVAGMIVQFSLWPAGPMGDGRWLPYLTHQFLHGGPIHLLMNIAMLAQVGPLVERRLGSDATAPIRFAGYYLLCGIAGAFGFIALNPGFDSPMLGASGAISGLFGGFLIAALSTRALDAGIKQAVFTSGATFLAINVGLAALGRVTGFAPIAWESHLFGFIGGLLLWPLFVARIAR
jgi:membrane associated rhomboid family serine protease